MAKLTMPSSTAREIDGSPSGVICSWTGPLLRVFTASKKLLICHCSPDADIGYYPEREVVGSYPEK